jgi:hypothetical protein
MRWDVTTVQNPSGSLSQASMWFCSMWMVTPSTENQPGVWVCLTSDQVIALVASVAPPAKGSGACRDWPSTPVGGGVSSSALHAAAHGTTTGVAASGLQPQQERQRP